MDLIEEEKREGFEKVGMFAEEVVAHLWGADEDVYGLYGGGEGGFLGDVAIAGKIWDGEGEVGGLFGEMLLELEAFLLTDGFCWGDVNCCKGRKLANKRVIRFERV